MIDKTVSDVSVSDVSVSDVSVFSVQSVNEPDNSYEVDA